MADASKLVTLKDGTWFRSWPLSRVAGVGLASVVTLEAPRRRYRNRMCIVLESRSVERFLDSVLVGCLGSIAPLSGYTGRKVEKQSSERLYQVGDMF